MENVRILMENIVVNVLKRFDSFTSYTYILMENVSRLCSVEKSNIKRFKLLTKIEIELSLSLSSIAVISEAGLPNYE